MSQVNGPCQVLVTIFNDGGICRVHPPTTRVNVNDDGSYREEIVFQPVCGDVLIVLPAKAVHDVREVKERVEVSKTENRVTLLIPKDFSGTVIAGVPGVYKYMVACIGEQGVQSAVGNSDPIIIVGRRP